MTNSSPLISRTSECDNEEQPEPYSSPAQTRSPQVHMQDTQKSSSEDDAPEITYLRLGDDHEVTSDMLEINISCGQLQKIERLENCTQLKTLALISNYIERLEGLENNTQLESLELYQNCIPKIENISHLTNLRVLDLSFNLLRKIENLDSLVLLEKLYLSSNKIEEMEGLEQLVKLKLLELGSNRLRTIQGISSLTNLEELWLGKNKISNITIHPLPHLKRFSLQSNRLTTLDPLLFETCTEISELYLSHNRLAEVPHYVKRLTNLLILDLGGNVISRVDEIAGLTSLEELWLNDNKVEDVQDVKPLRALTSLKTLYLERNPLQERLGPGYRQSILEIVPWITQLDALLVAVQVAVLQHSGFADQKQPHSILKR